MQTTQVTHILPLMLTLGCTSLDGATDHPTELQNDDAVEFAAAEECGAAYPKGFPCLPGGLTHIDEPMVTPFPGYTLLAVVEYPIPARSLSDRIVAAATTAGWSNTGTREGPEPDGVRYRTSFVRGDTSLAISVWPKGSGAMLQVTHVERM
jgi:hypothetical protein